MITAAILMVSLTCPPTLVVNRSQENWNRKDAINAASAKKRCKKKYPDNPCLVKFIKQKPLTYRVICGKKR